MLIGNRKERGRVCTVILHVFKKTSTPSNIRLTAIMKLEKPKSDPRFKPGLPRKNAMALPLQQPPLPKEYIRIVRGLTQWFKILLSPKA